MNDAKKGERECRFLREGHVLFECDFSLHC
jgi:hypothetical protein